MKKYVLLISTTTMMMMIPAGALAVDGQILINQSTVMAAGGFPYTISQPGSYKLSGNLVQPASAANSAGILILSSNVSIDLNGFSIIGALPCLYPSSFQNCATFTNSIGISSPGSNTVVISNGSVTQFLTGISIQNGTLKDLLVSGNADGIHTHGLVLHCTVFNNNSNGITGGMVQESIVFNSGQNGIFQADSVFNSRVFGNGVFGIQQVLLYGANNLRGNTSLSAGPDNLISLGTNVCDNGRC